MKASLCWLLPLLILASEAQDQPTKRPRTKPKQPRPPRPGRPLRPTPSFPRPQPREPAEPTDLPPPLPPGPPSLFPDCPRECYCPYDFPSALYCDSRNLRKVPVIPSRIHYLYLQNNFISELPLEAFKNASGLRWINLDNNRIRKVDQKVLERLPSLVFLYMEKNQLEEVPVALPRSLEQLRLSQNLISKIPPGAFSKLEKLLLLDLQSNRLRDDVLRPDTFQGLKSLMQLNLAHNTLRKMPPKVPPAIHQLYLDSNRIETIPSGYFKAFPNLAFIRLNYNRLSDRGLPRNCFNISNLLVLHLAHNQISSVPAISSRLEHLYLNNNSIEKINGTQICPNNLVAFHDFSSDLENVPHLRYLRLDGNHLKPPIPLDLMMCFRLLQSVVI
ncbi:prolargin [Erinaceus europaeus]|uniref:Prolargin n=1 Tax=Erinaceus europaeus TaxID=9365 RepID=A0A1S2ZNN2_ERIEU|nr:prolargin [Erinaceus europaeus]XP_060034604.1 prolargin [Erinaceus europaeus]